MERGAAVKTGPYAEIGAYGVSEAARFARVNTQTARRWIRGYGPDKYAPVLEPDLPPVGNRYALSFLDLVDLLVVGRFREQGHSLQSIRRSYAWLSKKLGTRHPFAHNRLLTDGSDIFLEMFAEVWSEESLTGGSDDHSEEHQLIEVGSGQQAIPELLRPYLRQIDYAQDTLEAKRWRIAEGVVLDPAQSFGKPTLAHVGTTTFVLASAYWANGENATLVAELFDVSSDAVHHAVAFEMEFSNRAA